jgi:rhomboid protease GluP
MVTRVLIAINVLVYLVEVLNGDANGTGSFTARGALYGPDVAAGEWWRVVTSAFLHAGISHIAFNMFALFVIGRDVELLYGHVRMAIIYAFGIAGSGISVLLFSFNIGTVGASGAIFALFGAVLAAGLQLGKPGRQLVQQTGGVIILNLLLGFTLFSGIVSNAAHIGGLVTGVVIGFALFMGTRKSMFVHAIPAEPVITAGGVYEPPEYVATATDAPAPLPPHPHEP